jgi:fructuronate reductase
MKALQLNRSSVPALPEPARPCLPPGSVGPGIVHIGLGAFHRAHQAVYTEEAMAAKAGDWGIVAVAPRSRELIDVLRRQDGLFSVTSLSGDVAQTRAVASLVGVHHLPAEPTEVLNRLADPLTRVITLTVTEKAYRITDEVRADLSSDRGPRTVPGLLVRGLRQRALAGGPPIAVVCCDNLPSNGTRLRALVAQALGSIPDWMSFPSTMVDRIVPATTPATLARAEAALGFADLAAVDAEPYRQWVIEDVFPAGRPAWEAAGAVLTDDVTAWERLKLRVLNGVHSTSAYLGALAGCRTIADAVALPGMLTVLRQLVAEDIAPTVEPPPGVIVTEYGDQVLERFANTAIEHRTLQVAMDGSQKLPQRLLSTIAERRRAGRMPRYAALAIAAWMRFLAGTADDGEPLPLDDPLADVLRAHLHEDPQRTVSALTGLDAVFPPAFADDAALQAEITSWLQALSRHGAAATVAGAA